MSERKRDAETTKARILGAARRLFAEHDISAVSIRDIAKASGVSHGLVQQYFGTREHMIAAIIQDEIAAFFASFPHIGPGPHSVEEVLRSDLRTGQARFHDFAALITRAQLAGVKPETMLDPATTTPAMSLAAAIRDLQSDSPTKPGAMDPRLVSAYVNAALFAFETIGPWLMASVGLRPEDYEARLDEITDISVKLVGLAAGAGRALPLR
jgi:AcrR family transcriptional regulator